MKNTIIEIEQKNIKTRRIVIKGVVPEYKLDRIAAIIEESSEYNHPDDVIDIIEGETGLEILDADMEGCYLGSEYVFLDNWTEEADNG